MNSDSNDDVMKEEVTGETGQRALTDDDYFHPAEVIIEVDRTRHFRWGWSVYARQYNPVHTLFREALGITWSKPYGARDAEKLFVENPVLMTLDEKQVQAIMDGLWRTGVRPTDEVVSDKGTIAAMKQHLIDLQKIVFTHLLPNAFQSTILSTLEATEERG